MKTQLADTQQERIWKIELGQDEKISEEIEKVGRDWVIVGIQGEVEVEEVESKIILKGKSAICYLIELK